MNKYNLDGIKYPSIKENWRRFEQNNSTIILNVLYIKKVEICPAYISKINSNYGKKIILLIITNVEKKDGIILQ